MNFEMREIKKDEYDEAMKLVLDVYMEFEAPLYGEEGVKTFLRDIVNSEKYKRDFEEGNNIITAAFCDGKMAGVIGTRGIGHISIVFTKKEYHRKGVATGLMKFILAVIKKNHQDIKEVTLNSSPYGLPFYHKFGFVDTEAQRQDDGIIYTPMKYVL